MNWQLLILLSASLLATVVLSPARAQLVNDGATNTLANVSTNINGSVTVGTNGAFTLLVLSDNTLLTNSAHGTIGANATARSNEVQLLAPTARWQMANNLFVGSNGAASHLVVGNSAYLSNNNAFLGNGASSSNNVALVTDAGSLWTNRAELRVGNAGPGNQLIVSNGARLFSLFSNVGQQTGSSNNLVVVTGSGSVWTNHLYVNVGTDERGNRLRIDAGGQVGSDEGRVGAGIGGYAEALVTGPGSLWNNRRDLAVGLNGANNLLVVSNGAAVVAGNNGRLGVVNGATNNVVVVTGAGSLWSNQLQLFVGEGGPRNRMEVNGGGRVVSSNTYVGNVGASNVALITGNGSLWSNPNEFVVGNFSAGNQVVVNDGGRVESSLARLGVNASSSGNSVLLSGPDSAWSNQLAFFVGVAGTSNRLVIAEGALLADSYGILGQNSSASNNEVVVTGPGSLWTNAFDCRVGDLSPGNRLIISNGGTVLANLGYIGSQPSSSNNLVLVTGPGSTWSNTDDLVLGSIGPGNRLVVSNGALVQNLVGFIGLNTSSSNNAAVITGPGSRWTMPNGALFIGMAASRGNQLVVSNGAAVDSIHGHLGFDVTSGPNEALITGAGSSWTIMNTFNVGRLGSRSLLLVSNAAEVFVGTNLIVGGSIASTNNRVVVAGGSLQVTNPFGSGTLDIQRGTNVLNAGLMEADRLRLTNAQGFFEFNGGLLTTRGAAINNGTPFVVGRTGTTPAVWDVRAGLSTHFVGSDIYLGSNSSFNQLILTNGALLTNNGSGLLGWNAGATSNSATLAGVNSRWLLDDGLFVGTFGSGNRLVVSNGATLVTSSSSSIGNETTSTNNEAIVTGPGSSWVSGPGQMFVGYGGRNNTLLVSDGAFVANSYGTIGHFFANTTNNLALVTGAGSWWSNAFELRVGGAGARNRLVVSNGAVVSAGSAGYVGFSSTSTNNQLSVEAGTLYVTNASATGILDVRRGTATLKAGLVEVDRLLMTNTLGSFQLHGGTLSTRNTTVNNGVAFHVGDNVGPATLFLADNGLHVFNGLTVDNQGTLSGNGTIGGSTLVLDGGIVSPGDSIGKITFNPPGIGPLLFGTMLMELSKDGTILTNDQIQTMGALTYGGNLTVTHLGPTALAAGDKFKLFNAPFYGGSFQSVSLPALAPGLRWVTNLLVDGSIEVFAVPPVGAGFALSFDGTNDFVESSNDSRFNAYPLVATAWINTTQSIGEVGILNKYLAGSFNGWHVGLFNGEVRAWYARDNANHVGSPGGGVNGGSVSDGEWHHVAFTVNDTGASLYVDGFFKEKLAWVGTPGSCTTTQSLRLARYPGGAGEFYRGAIDEVAVWRFLEPTPEEIKTNLNRGLIGSENGLVLYHRYHEGSGTVARNAADATGGNADGYLQNGVAWVPGLVLRPAIRTRLATAVAEDSATLHGVSNPGLTNTIAWFEWGTTTNYGSVTALQALGSGGGNTNFTQSLTGLTQNVTYHFRAVASNSIGASFGVDRSFVTTGTNLLSPRVQHTATLLPNGKVLVAGGQGQDYDPLASVEMFDPTSGTWAFGNGMSTNRYSHTATVLPNGKVLVAGGRNQDFLPSHASAELYDPVAEIWTPTGSLHTNRADHTATLLMNGKVLVTGGSSSAGLITRAELYDPATGDWSETGPALIPRYYHTATRLPDGKVLVTGGIDGSGTVASAELYDPISGTWTNTGSMTTNRYGHTATLLRNGKVLVVGGRGLVNFLNTAELYDPATGNWTATVAMLNYRFGHTATLLPDGKVLASGDGIGVPSVYNPITGTWTDVPGPDPNSGATATLLPNGNVLIAGGIGNFFTDGDPSAEAAVYFTPNTGSWMLTAPMANARDGHTATLLPDGRVIVASFTNSELYHPITGTWSNTGALNSGRNGHTATLLPNGKVLAVGGINFSTVTGAELYDLATGMWTNTGDLATNRIGGHTATLLFNGKVLVTGGNGEFFGPSLRNAELYDPALGNWTNTGSLTTNRSGHWATLLPNGKVLVTGGLVTGGFFPSTTSTAELFDPSNGLWTALPPMATNRSAHIAVLLPTGKVLVAGGSPASLSAANGDAELFDPATGTWETTGPMTTGRQGATATLLANGKVLVAGGYNLGYLASAELYDPGTGKWTATALLGAAHISHTSTLLPNGRVLVAGGYFGSSNTNRAELYDIGLGFSNSWRPQITGISSPVNLGGSLILTGAQFRGLSDGSGGNSSQNSSTDYPIVQLRSVESQQTRFVPSAEWTTNSLSSTPVAGLPPGWTMATVFVNGIPSQSSLVSLLKPTAIVTLSNLFQDFDGTAKSVSVATVPPGLMVSVTYDGSPNAPTNIGSYTVVGTIIDDDYDSTPVTNTLVIAPLRDFGVDVSHFQNESGVPQSSWDQMFAAGKRFVFIKATEGLTGPHDPTMVINVQRASAAGLLVGVYHYAHPENRPTTNGAILEASNMVVYAGSAIGPGRLRPVLDLEFNAATLSTEALTDWAIAFCNEIIARRGPSAAPIIYCNQTFANNEFDSRLADYDLWLRTVGTGANPAFDDPPGIGFAVPTGVFNNWSFWQYSSTGSSGGLSPLDLNVCHSEFKPLESFIITNVVPTPIHLTGLAENLNSGFQFNFTNTPGATFTVLATTNASWPLSNWTILGAVTETSPGLYQFTDPQTTNQPQRYYRVRSP